MFNVGPMELVVLGIVAVIVLGPDRLPGLARDAAQMIRTLRELATGARTQLRDELGPEFADMDLRNLNPRTALQRIILGDEENGLRADLRKLDPREDFRAMDPRNHVRDAFRDDPVSMQKPSSEVYAEPSQQAGPYPASPSLQKPPARPLARGEAAPYDDDAT